MAPMCIPFYDPIQFICIWSSWTKSKALFCYPLKEQCLWVVQWKHELGDKWPIRDHLIDPSPFSTHSSLFRWLLPGWQDWVTDLQVGMNTKNQYEYIIVLWSCNWPIKGHYCARFQNQPINLQDNGRLTNYRSINNAGKKALAPAAF